MSDQNRSPAWDTYSQSVLMREIKKQQARTKKALELTADPPVQTVRGRISWPKHLDQPVYPYQKAMLDQLSDRKSWKPGKPKPEILKLNMSGKWGRFGVDPARPGGDQTVVRHGSPDLMWIDKDGKFQSADFKELRGLNPPFIIFDDPISRRYVTWSRLILFSCICVYFLRGFFT